MPCNPRGAQTANRPVLIDVHGFVVNFEVRTLYVFEQSISDNISDTLTGARNVVSCRNGTRRVFPIATNDIYPTDEIYHTFYIHIIYVTLVTCNRNDLGDGL